MMATGLLLLKIQRKYPDLEILPIRKWRIRKDLIKSIISISLPAAIEKLIMRSGQLIYGGMIIAIGTKAYAAHNIAETLKPSLIYQAWVLVWQLRR